MSSSSQKPIKAAIIVAASLVLSACGGSSDDGAQIVKPDIAEVDTCPTTGADLRGTTETLHCKCDEFKVGTGVVFGSGPYLDDSSICRAAAHAGIVDAKGEGEVVSVTPMPGDGIEFTESEANGISASPYISSAPAKGAYKLN
ncbi:MAG: LCCL domain-containing protein [Erythrobacter sp.]